MLVDGDLDGSIDFDTTVGGVLEARGRVFEQLYANTSIVSITTTPPFAEAFFHNVSGGDATFTITVNSSAFITLGPPLGWAVFYNGRADDRMAQPVNIPSHSVTAQINAGALTLATVAGTAITFVDDIDLMASGVNPSDSSTDLRVIFAFYRRSRRRDSPSRQQRRRRQRHPGESLQSGIPVHRQDEQLLAQGARQGAEERRKVCRFARLNGRR
jgi:hypothetical protein